MGDNFDPQKPGSGAEAWPRWVRQADRDQRRGAGLTTDEYVRINHFERENRELPLANWTLKNSSASFAQAELDGRTK